MLPIKPKLPKDQQQLLKSFSVLSAEDQQTLLTFAEFLASRTPQAEPTVTVTVPLDIERPEKESVIAAMRRLTATYPMLDTDALLNDASVLMGAHLMQGKPAVDVIDELQVIFEQAFVTFKK